MFKDIGKAVKDVFEDDYFYCQKLKINTTNDSKLSWLTEGQLNAKSANASICASMKGENLSLDKLRVKNDGRILLEASYKASDTTKFTLSAEDGRQEAGKSLVSSGKFGCEIKMPLVYGTVEIDAVNGPNLNSSAVFNFHRRLKVGGEGTINFQEMIENKKTIPEFSYMNVACAYKGKDFNLSAKTYDSLEAVKVSYLHSVLPRLIIVSQVDYRFKTNVQKLSVSSRLKLEDDSIVKAKINSNGILATSFQHNLSKLLKLTLCAEVDVKDWTSDSHKFGLGLAFE